MRRTVVAVAILLFAGSGASAQVRSGLNEANVNGHITSVSDGDESTTVMQLQLRYGRFLSDRAELGLTWAANKFEDIDLFGSVGAFGAYHFGALGATTVPYLGAQVSLGYGDEIENPIGFGAFGGLKFFVGPGGALSAEAFVDRTSYSDADIDLTSFGLRLGVSIFF